MPTLKIGVSLSAGGSSTATQIRDNALHAEQAGLDSAFVGDQLVSFRPILDSTVALASAAAVTNRIELGYGTMVLALRPVAWAAKQIATLQQLSGDRIILGVGVGGSMYGEAGWRAAGVPYQERGKRTDAALDVLPDLITGKPAIVNGQEVTLNPGANVPPIWVGGGSDAALRRAVRYGSAWFPSMMTAAQLPPVLARLAGFADAAGLRVPALTLGGVAGIGGEQSAMDDYGAMLATTYGVPAEVAARLPITGNARQAADQLAEYAEAGVRHLVLGLVGGEWKHQCDLLAEAKALVD